MKIIPVIDLKDGLVVRGVAGQRELYRAVETVLNCDATPHGVARALVAQFGFQTVYVADLDAIEAANPNWEAYDEIASEGLRLIVDAGTNCIQRASQFIDRSPTDQWCCGVVVGLESLRGERDLPALCKVIGRERAVFSLDLRQGKPLTEISVWREVEPIELADRAVDAGFERLIVLDLASVGVGQGITVRALCEAIRSRHPRLEITSGGGVRNLFDLTELAAAGCDAALVASALHDARLTPADISSFR